MIEPWNGGTENNRKVERIFVLLNYIFNVLIEVVTFSSQTPPP